MDIYTVSFFGHREVEMVAEIESKLDQLLHDLITQKQYVEYLIGRDGEFDLLAASAIRRAVKRYGYGNTSIILVLPYMKAEYRDDKQYYLSYYDEVEICSESSDISSNLIDGCSHIHSDFILKLLCTKKGVYKT